MTVIVIALVILAAGWLLTRRRTVATAPAASLAILRDQATLDVQADSGDAPVPAGACIGRTVDDLPDAHPYVRALLDDGLAARGWVGDDRRGRLAAALTDILANLTAEQVAELDAVTRPAVTAGARKELTS